MKEQLRFGIVGCGVIGAAHAEAIESLPEAELVAVADVVPERAHALADQYGVRPHTSLGDMLDEEDLDVVDVCTASGLHGEHACAIMRSGRHVIVEKPIEVRLDAIDEMLRVQAEAQVQLAVIFQHRFDSSSRRLRGLLDEGALGRLVAGNAAILWWRSQAYYDSGDWRGTWALDGGGVLMNQAIHSIDLLQWFMGPVRSVLAYTETRTHRMETEDTAVATLRFRNGALGSITATTGAYPGVTTRLEVLGDRGSAVIERDRLRYLALATADGDAVGAYGREGREQPEAEVDADEPPSISTHAMQIRDAVEAIRIGRKPLVDGHDARMSVRLILAIYESARSGREVLLE